MTEKEVKQKEKNKDRRESEMGVIGMMVSKR
jgi:hypothetical protein